MATAHRTIYERLRRPCIGVNKSWAFRVILRGQRSTFLAQPPFSFMWKLLCVLSLSCLLPTTAFLLPSEPPRSSDDSPIRAAFHVQPESLIPGSNLEWNFPPNPNSTHHLIFNSVSGLLHRWPNTLRRNGVTLYTTLEYAQVSHKAAF
jgi:hypothetical protein